MRIWIAVLAASSLVACGDDAGSASDAGTDAPAVLRYPISFMVRGDVPLFLAFADDDGTWTPIATNAANMYSIQATNRHAIATVCGDAVTGFETAVVLRTRFDDDPFFFCSNTGSLPPQKFAVTGQMMQPGEVHMQASDEGSTSPWTFDLSVSGGMHDLIAYGDSMVLLRRGVSVTAAATLPAIDLAQGGEAYATTPVLLGNALGDETVETVATLFTGNELSDYTRSGTTLYAVPPSLLGVNDFQFAEILASTDTTTRRAPIDTSGPTPMITLMPRLSDITFTEHGATWTELPDSTAEIRVAMSDARSSINVDATGGYINGDTEVAVVLDIPGFDDAWRLIDTRFQIFAAYDDELASTSIAQNAMAARQVQAQVASRHRRDRVRFVRSAAADVARAHR